MNENNPPVATGRGDDGTTTLFGGGRLSKTDPRIIALGDIDEASSALGLARAEADIDGSAEIGALILDLQRLLYRVMGDIAMPNEDNFVVNSDLAFVDETLEEWRDKTEIPKEFVIPGQTRLGALLDISRSVTRRAERSLVASEASSTPHPHAGRVLNRLSDLLFIVARAADGGQTLSKS